jgi:hypothetical protein
MALIKNIILLSEDATPEEVLEVLQSDPLFFPGKVADELDPDNGIRKIRKVKNIEWLMQQPLEEVIAAYNTVALRRALRIKNAKQALPFILMGLNFWSGKADDDKQLKIINAIKILIQNLF